jgi:hypothetical protein
MAETKKITIADMCSFPNCFEDPTLDLQAQNAALQKNIYKIGMNYIGTGTLILSILQLLA